MAAGQKKKPVLTPAARVAAVIVALGKEEAAEVYKFLKEEEIETISLEVAKLHNLSQEDLQEIVDDFYGLCVTQKVISEGGVIYARDVLEKAFGPEQAKDYMERISQAMQTRPFDFVRKTNYRSLMMMVQNEMPQTIAFILSYAKADQSSKIISELPREIQLEVVRRIASLESVSPEIGGTGDGAPMLFYRQPGLHGNRRRKLCGRYHEPHRPCNRKAHFRRTQQNRPGAVGKHPQAHVRVRGYYDSRRYVHSARAA